MLRVFHKSTTKRFWKLSPATSPNLYSHLCIWETLALHKVRSEKDLILHHENALSHTSQKNIKSTWKAWVSSRCEFFLFPKFKENFKDKHFSSDEDEKVQVRKWRRRKSSNFFRNGHQKLVTRWRKYFAINGNYVKKWINQWVEDNLYYYQLQKKL